MRDFIPNVVGHRLLCQEALAILVSPREKPGSSPVSRLISLCCARASPGIASGSGVILPSVSHSGLAFYSGRGLLRNLSQGVRFPHSVDDKSVCLARLVKNLLSRRPEGS